MLSIPESDGDEDEEYDEEEQDGQEYEEAQIKCPHSYAFAEALPSDERDIYREKWRCIYCNHGREL